jgi:tetratricopeptide (TPR) repeat protein
MRKLISLLVCGFLLLCASAAPAIAQAGPAEISFWESVRDSKIPAEIEAYLKVYPNGQFAPLARIRLDKLRAKSPGSAETIRSTEIRSTPRAVKKWPPVIVAWQEKTIPVTLGGSGKRGLLGVKISSATSFKNIGGWKEKNGAVILGVSPGGSAESAGLLWGDIILKFDNQPVVAYTDLVRIVSKTPPGKKLDIVIMRPNVDDAIRQYRALADKGAENAAVNLGFLYLAKGDRKNAFEWSLKAATQGDQVSMFNVAEAYEHGAGVAKNHAEAINWYRKADCMGKDHERAIAACTRIIDDHAVIVKNRARAYNNRGLAYANKNDYDRAIADYTEAIRLDPKYADAYGKRGNVYLVRKDNDRAIADYADAIRLNPKFAVAYNNRGLAYANKNDYDHAIADFTEAIRLDPKFAIAYNGRGIANAHKKNYDRAIADYNEAITLNPKYAVAYYNRGNAYYNKREYNYAIPDYTETIRLNAAFVPAYTQRASAYENTFRTVYAIADYRKVLLLDSSNSTAAAALKRLGAKPF